MTLVGTRTLPTSYFQEPNPNTLFNKLNNDKKGIRLKICDQTDVFSAEDFICLT